MNQAPIGAALAADYFDGVSARARPVSLRLVGGELLIEGEGVALRLPVREVRWPERTRHGGRVAHLRGGGSVQARDAAAWDAWARAGGLRESAVVRAQQSWRGVIVAMLMLLAAGAAGYRWGVPWIARGALAALPLAADRAIGEAALRSFDGTLLQPSQVPAARQQQIRSAFAAALAHAEPALARTAHELRFHASPKVGSGPNARSRLGPNAFALPGGTIVVTDEMLQLLDGRDDVLIGVLGHELGHVTRRHGMRLVVQATLIGSVAGIALGDFSSVLAGVPALLGQSAYSRGFEREADEDAIALLRADGRSPAVMVELFERLAAQRPGAAGKPGEPGAFDLGIALASHPADAERIQRFRDAAAR
jgi:Zn-dependent protease with chaperone function